MMTAMKYMNQAIPNSQTFFGRLPLVATIQRWQRARAFQNAVDRAYQHFAQEHRQWVDSFFDAHFVGRLARPVLGRHLYASVAALPSPAELAALWADQFRPDDPARKYTADAALVAADFLNRLEAEL